MNDVVRLELPLIGPDEWDTTFPDKERHFDRRGNPITFREWVTLTEHVDKDGKLYKIVRQEYVGDYWVSTVWLGIDHGWGQGAPIIFETMVFDHGPERTPKRVEFGSDDTSWSDLDMERYATEEEALEGHARICEKVRLINEAFS